jgi:hypothetical protein
MIIHRRLRAEERRAWMREWSVESRERRRRERGVYEEGKVRQGKERGKGGGLVMLGEMRQGGMWKRKWSGGATGPEM